MNLIPVAKFPISKNLSSLRSLLAQEQIIHRFTEESNYQVLWVVDAVPKETILDLIGKFESNQKEFAESSASFSQQIRINVTFEQILIGLVRYPVTAISLCLGVMGYLLINWFKIPEFNILLFFGSLTHIIQTGETWRLMTPTFLHFGFLHILFNGLWIYVLGRKLESYLKLKSFLLLFFVTALVANISQDLLGSSILFGGLSGVVYGYFGFLWISGNVLKIAELKIQNSLIGMMIFFLILGFSGIITKIFSIGVANWAHLGGLVAGCLMPFWLIDRTSRTKQL